MENRIEELVEIPPVRTVIQLKDIENPELRNFLAESFVITDEVQEIMGSFFASTGSGQGEGFFIRGNFGSGKSHLLGVLSLLLTDERAWKPLLDEYQNFLQPLREKILPGEYLVLNLSLVEHSSREYLENIILSGLAAEIENIDIGGREQEFITEIARKVREDYPDRLQSFLREEDISAEELFKPGNLKMVERLIDRINLPYRFNYNRKQVFDRLEERLNQDSCRGLVIFIDELSEFLRSKTDGRRFNEDIRFLQFLGEFAAGNSCWIAATLQEEIEKTGETTPAAFNKIKDRYPARFSLTGQHIRELISSRLIKKKKGAEEKIEQIYKLYCSAFSQLPFSGREFKDLYPVHPLTVKLLDNLKPLFSQHRGVVDFIHYRLRGDENRSIPGMLSRPAENLLTPDKIFDHFLPRIKDMMETAPYYDKVYHYYEQEIDSLLEPEDREMGLKLIKLLILFAISPVAGEYTVRNMAHMLLERLTELDTSVNYEYIGDILARLYNHGAYLEREEAESGEQYHYYISLEADINLIIKRKTEYIRSNFFAGDKRLFTETGKLVKNKLLPLAELLQNPERTEEINWQQSRRKGHLLLTDLTEIGLEKIERLGSSMIENEYEFCLLLAFPLKTAKQRQHLVEVLRSGLGEKKERRFLCWLPREIEEEEFMARVLSRLLLLQEYAEDNTETGTEIKERLRELLQEDRSRVEDILLNSYWEGQIIKLDGTRFEKTPDTGYLPFNRYLEEVISGLLGEIYPDHVNIAPYRRVLTVEQMDEIIEDFLKSGELINPDKNSSLKKNIEAFLKPMGFVKNLKNGLRLMVRPDRNPLVKHFFSLLEEDKTPMSEINRKLKKGRFGPDERQFKLLIFVLLCSGYITAYGEERKLSLTHLNARNFGRIKYLGYGEIIESEFQRVLQSCALLPPRFRDKPFSLPLQQQIWEYLTEEKRKLTAEIEELKQRLRSPEMEDFNRDKLLSHLDKVSGLLAEIKVSYSSEEGLERFASHYRSLPNIDQYLNRLEKIREFVDKKLDIYNRVKEYLRHPALKIPEGERYEQLEQFYHNLQESLNDEAVIFVPDFYSKMIQGFKEFRRLYIEKYSEEHRQQKGRDRFQSFHRLKDSPAYKLLSTLSNIRMISVKDDLIKVDRKIARSLKQACDELQENNLRQHPICSCGFQLGEKVELESVRSLQRVIDNGIEQYLLSLQEDETREKIEDYLDKMEKVGKKRFARPIRQLLTLDPEEKNLEKLQELINRNLINRINEALSEEMTLVERDLDRLYENLVDRNFSVKQLQKLFDEWLNGTEGIGENTYIRIISHRTSPVQEGEKDLLVEYIGSHFPDLLSLLEQVGEEDFSLLLILKIWLIDHEQREVVEEVGDGYQVYQDYWPNPALQNALESMIQEIFTRKEGEKIRQRVSELARNKLKKQYSFVDIFSLFQIRKPEELVDFILRERIVPELQAEAVVLLVKKLENTAISRVQLEELIDRSREGENKFSLLATRDYPRLIYYYLQLKKMMAEIEKTPDIRSQKDWEEIYCNNLASLDYYYSQLQTLAGEVNLKNILPLEVIRDQYRQKLRDYQSQFSDFLDREQFRVQEDGVRTSLLTIDKLINDKYRELLQTLNRDQGLRVLMDGMRWDLWRLIKNVIRERLPLRMIEEGSLLAYRPTNTERQLKAMRGSGFKGDIIEADQFSTRIDPEAVVRFTYIDDKVHTLKDDYLQFVEEIIFHTENKLLPFLENLTSGSPVLIFSDHGYRLNRHFKKEEKYESPRYLHGGDSMFEVIVPWAMIYKI